MLKYLLIATVSCLNIISAAELNPDPEQIRAQATQLVEFSDKENQARAKILEECDKKAQEIITLLAVSRCKIIERETKELKEIYGNWVTDEILALKKERSELSLTPEMNFLTRLDYVVDKKSYEDQRLSFGDRRAKYSLQFRYLVEVIQLKVEYERVKDSDLLRTQGSAFQEMISRLFEEAKKAFLESASLYKNIDPEGFLETHDQL
ncbi:MAG: hypothetical protein Q8Q56_05760, partial [Alphaproteobacteria bacterium]|nr:hypothetical protein [Alphaproteobacteria bacterium]